MGSSRSTCLLIAIARVIRPRSAPAAANGRLDRLVVRGLVDVASLASRECPRRCSPASSTPRRLVVGLDDRCERRDRLVVAAQAHHDHALRRAAEPLHVLDRHLDHRAAGRDQHHLVAVAHDARADELARAVGELHRLHAHAAAALDRVLRDRASACRSRSRSRRAGRRRPAAMLIEITSSPARSRMPVHAGGVAPHRPRRRSRGSGSPGPSSRP